MEKEKEMQSNENILQSELDIWPCTILSDRYNGQYSGGKWIALNMYEEHIPKAIQGGDGECMDYWNSNPLVVGKGDTPNEALTDLYNNLNK